MINLVQICEDLLDVVEHIRPRPECVERAYLALAELKSAKPTYLSVAFRNLNDEQRSQLIYHERAVAMGDCDIFRDRDRYLNEIDSLRDLVKSLKQLVNP